MVIRLQCKSGRHILSNITSQTTLGELQSAIEQKTNVSPDRQKILYGYPPKEIESYNVAVTIFDIGIRSGDTVTLQELTEARRDDYTLKTVAVTTSDINADDEVVFLREEVFKTGRGELKREVVPADNSCLFRSISILTNSTASVNELRQLAASMITSQPDRYSDAVLGRPQREYIQWILRDESWGGGIELSVFSELYQVELNVVDVQSLRIDKFGSGYSSKGLLIYDGIHYDPLVLVSPPTGAIIQRLFPCDEETVVTDALKIAREAQKWRQYTDLSNFSLRCLVCGDLLTGQTDAQQHATSTGHINFGEV